MKEIGEYLKREREKRQISLRKVADETKIPIRYLEAIERGDASVIPGEVYLKGFLRTYAEEIGLDPDQVLERYRQLTEKETESEAQIADSRVPTRRKKVSWHLRYERAFLAVLLLVLLIIAIVAAFRGRGQDHAPEPKPQVQQEDQEPVRPETEPEAPSVVTRDVQLFTRDTCWVEAYSQGKRIFALMMRPGDSRQLPVHENLVLLLGKPAAVSLKYGEEPVQGLGKETATVVFDKEGYRIYRGRREEEFYR